MPEELRQLWAAFWPLFAAGAGGSLVTAVAMHLRYGRRGRADYRAGATDMEKLIRDKAVVDFRDKGRVEAFHRSIPR